MSGEAHGTYWATPWLAAYYAEDEIDGSGDPDTEIGFVAIQIVEGGSLRCFPGSFRCFAQLPYCAGRRGDLRRYVGWRGSERRRVGEGGCSVCRYRVCPD